MRSARHLLQHGPLGLCGDCGQESFVRLSSFTRSLEGRAWTASHDLLYVLYADVLKQVRQGGKRGKRRNPKTGEMQEVFKSGRVVVCATCELKTKKAEKSVAATFVWFGLDGDVGQLPDNLAGPFCSRCLRHEMTRFEHMDGSDFDPPVYTLALRDDIVDTICQHSKPRQKTETTQSDLF
jgi:hypothetical protein